MLQKNKTLFVYGDFDWLETPTFIGTLTYESLRGKDSYGFSFSPEWIGLYPDLYLSEDLRNFSGWQFTGPESEIFACFSDALPDRWGRMLINRKEQIEAQLSGRPVRHLSSYDYLTAIDDFSRMGAFRFSFSEGGPFINCDPDFKIPPLTGVSDLLRASSEIEYSEEIQTMPERKWINQLVNPGTSLGGARPKASVKDEAGNLTVAKFPSRNDDYDVGLWEHFSHLLAVKAGLKVADTNVLKTGQYHTLLSRRFDRTSQGKRIHFASALTMLGLKDGDNASSGKGYPDIVDFIIQHGAEVEANLEELFRRVAFYILVGNSDDHFRNHGFLLTPKGWTLSPAYDINPTNSDCQSLLINRETSLSDLDLLRRSVGDYLITGNRGNEIIEQTKDAFADWENEAIKIGLSRRDINLFSARINSRLKS